MHTNRSFAFKLLTLLLLLILLDGCMPSGETHPPESPTTLSTGQPEAQVEYRNSELGFSFSLPESWEGFSIRTGNWEGLKSGDLGDEIVEQGPMVYIVHPESTIQQPRQDIPVMAISIDQWDQMLRGEWHIGAAPIGPLELGRNSRYVLALPARYNYAFPAGWEEVEQIIQSRPLVTFEPIDVP